MRLSDTAQSSGTEPLDPPQAPQEERRPRRRTAVTASLLAGLLVLFAGAAFWAARVYQMETYAAGPVNQDCTLMIPAHPLSAGGLSTPYQLRATSANSGPCDEDNPDQAAFVQGAVLDTATGQISIYNPLVIDQGTQPALAPVVPQLPAHAVVALWFGFNGATLRLEGGADAHCVNGLGTSLFGQFSYCNAPQFFQAANRAIQAGQLSVPPLGTAEDGLPCPSVRDFSVVDQDQSDNVTASYLMSQSGQLAQNTTANLLRLGGGLALNNGSDNRLLDVGLDGALGCTPWMAPDLADAGRMVPALPLNELQAAQDQRAPVALVPLGDPMTLASGQEDTAKTTLYRLGVDQGPADRALASTKHYCQELLVVAPGRLQLDRTWTQNRPSPDPTAANNLFTFLAQRFNTTWGADQLNCAGLLQVPSPVTLQVDDYGVAIRAWIRLSPGGAPQASRRGVPEEEGA
jgi:hypothetical protein